MLDFLPGKKPEEMTLMINNYEVIADNITYVETMDTVANAATAVIPWFPGKDPTFDRDTKAYKYSECAIYIGGNLRSEMIIYNVEHLKNEAGLSKKLEMWSKTADLIDSTVLPPYEESFVKLSDRCKRQSNPFGIQVVIGDDIIGLINVTHRQTVTVGMRKQMTIGMVANFKSDSVYFDRLNPNYIYVPVTKSKLVTDEYKFPRVCAEPKDKIFDHLSKLAKQRSILLSCTKNGDLLLTRAKTDSKAVCTIDESSFVYTNEFKIKWDGRKRYRIYRALAKGSKWSITNVAEDKVVEAPRILTFDAGDDVPGNTKNVAAWMRNKIAAESLQDNDFTIKGFYIPGKTDQLWTPNTMVTVVSKTMDIPEGFTFIITQVSYTYDSNGTFVKLKIVPPSMYSNKEIDDPWGAE